MPAPRLMGRIIVLAKIGPLVALLATAGLLSSARAPGVAAGVAPVPTNAPVADPTAPPPIFPPVAPDAGAAAVPLQTESPTPAPPPASTAAAAATATPLARTTPLPRTTPLAIPLAFTPAPAIFTPAPAPTTPLPAVTPLPPHPVVTVTPAFPPLIPATEPPAGPLLVGPRGFEALPGDSGVAGGASFVVAKKWVKTVGTHVHVVLLGQTSSKLYSALGDDPKPYIPMVIHGLQGQNKAFNVLERQPVELCNQKDGYLVRYEDHSSEPLAASVVFAVSGGTLYTAIYEHDLGTPDLPAARLSIATLCPPYDDTDK